MFLLDYMISLVAVLMSVAFFTLMERKMMGAMHYRKGPSKIAVSGLSQPMADAAKLMTKEMTKMSMVKLYMFYTGPLISTMVMFLTWTLFEFSFTITPMSMKIILIFTSMSLTIYGMLLMSWGSNSKYSMLGGHRAAAQVMSYEVGMFITILVVSFNWKSYSMQMASTIQQGLWMGLMLTPVAMTWILMCLAESNRTPFDTAEGESEIVSGFNIEYGGGLFALIFISEYGMMMVLSFMTSMFFMGGSVILMKTLLIMFMFIWTRCSFPRVRYDKLMMMAWKMVLPFILTMLATTTVM
uniref:NADH-ubiquinone oxidoreductase chain 1 n=1 Tax=Histiostoma blomquisti TaxID=1902798 RepID=A0A342Y125_9ACAR|nr:NADH dehydrogenase subunit 1 [Histiostoma blomquisti]AOR08477.1 NADH dehydrogenase subunit 1 [Histiostoma blomquisti]